LLLCFLFLAPARGLSVLAQQASNATISGHVFDGVTGDPIEDVNVFIAGTFLGSATDSAGFYLIKEVAPGDHDLVVAMAGYEPQELQLQILQPVAYIYDFRLKPKVYLAPEIEISASKPTGWQKDLDVFKKLFLGDSHNAQKCKLVNPEVLDFYHDDVRVLFFANAEHMLEIENRALGYRVNFLLEKFVAQGQKVVFLGKTRFDELEPKNDKERNRWRRNRRRTYNGSMRHFLKILATGGGDMSRAGFKIMHTPDLLSDAESLELQEVEPSTLISPGRMEYERQLRFSGYLQITYEREKESKAFIYWRDRQNPALVNKTRQDLLASARPGKQTSWLKLNRRSVTIDTSGHLYDPMAVTTYGYWAWERVAELLPLEYRPR
ncbi:MAG: carboxypeptidase-like regulatory domain-containing protein, partial [Calditrichaeota bacterium]